VTFTATPLIALQDITKSYDAAESDSGELRIDGVPTWLTSPRDAQT
jgi:hypothetical protein